MCNILKTTEEPAHRLGDMFKNETLQQPTKPVTNWKSPVKSTRWDFFQKYLEGLSASRNPKIVKTEVLK